MKRLKSFDNSWEENIYSKGNQLNRYPYTDLISYVYRLYGEELKSGKVLRVLELGFGGGNNILFFAQEGCETYGIEGSSSAHAFAVQQLKEKNLKAELVTGDFIKLPYSDDFFDLVIDREAVYCNVPDAIREIIKEIHRVLKPVGRFITFMYSLEHGSRLSDNGKLIDTDTYIFDQGKFSGAGITHFFSKEEIQNDYLKDFEIEFMRHLRVDSLVTEQRNEYAEYHTCARKKSKKY
ncbi:class I SAM-dependent methyltransferase [candidate division KSB1 bacterium]|nr:class I SAM-dependent methyltransferase [candidate division KSB1 bacterium]